MFMYTDYNQHLLDNVKKIHFIGCGGSGMYPLIQILAAKGYEISGSDVLDGSIIRYEREMGVKVSLGHSADNVIGTDMVVYSAAISKDNVELNAAASYGIPTIERSVLLGYVSRLYKQSICVSGTHGKTTTTSMIPTHAGISLITVLPEQLQSPLMTAEWEHRLKEIERGEESPETFMQGIRDMVCELVKTYKTVLGADVLFPSGRAVVGKCPRCGSDVTESKKGYFCERNDCHFGLWRDNRFLVAKKVNLTKKMAETLLKDGKTYASGIFSEKTGKTYDAYIVLEDDGTKTAYRLEFERGKANGKQYS